mmetsp:Transcript_22014/g.65190  ORF Transcript_22014/g.65190 Transcript_22014/m.65190 type:complete len:522 (-) Transcript_22014:554-2119(-)|eukprot:CAMPEP_0113534314 /NCGR_PEP_ID=MMETSP0015_2-20120614/5094_1 /TAXON_ID=2838 /ORGANISM="Odontella" /LENGTH=521 /DNA_ID=CAMNT_0000433469 /DNA_START=120 /DNA_END=1685 /DNA_ORIENTATION=+ /assembly_acc=CAM_ASM_000160
MSATATTEQRGNHENVRRSSSMGTSSSASTSHSTSTPKSSGAAASTRGGGSGRSSSRSKPKSKYGADTTPPASVPPTDRMVPLPVLDRYYRRAVLWTAMFWILLVGLVLYFSPPESFRRQESSTAAGALGTASVVMGASVLTRVLAMMAQSMFASANNGEGSVAISGAALVGFFAQTSSCVMNGAMALYATPSFVDPVTGMRVFLLRWCEWAPLAFVMAFLTASIDAEEESKSGVQAAMRFALCQGLSTTLGLILPTLTSIPAWYCTLGLSVLLHLTLHPLMVQKTLTVLSVSDPTTVSLRESSNIQRKNRILVGGHLIQLLTAAWTLLVVLYMAAWFFHLPVGVNAVLECTADVVSKHFYLNYLIDAHHLIFSKIRKEDMPTKKDEKERVKKVKMIGNVKKDQEQNVAVVFTRGEKAATLMIPGEIDYNATLLDAVLLVRSTNKSMFEGTKEANVGVFFRTTLKDGAQVPFTVVQASNMRLEEIVSMRGATDAPRIEVVVVEQEEEGGGKNESNEVLFMK